MLLFWLEDDRYPGRYVYPHSLVPVPSHEYFDPSSKANFFHKKLHVNPAHYIYYALSVGRMHQ